MSVPKEVEDQAKQAEELHKQMYGEPKDEAPVEAEPVAEVADTPSDEPAPEPEVVEVKEEPKAETKAPAEDATAKELNRLKAQLSTLQGKYNAEIPRLNEALRERDRAISEMQTKPATSPQPKPGEDYYSKLKEDYGQEFVDNFKAAVRSEVAASVKESVEPVRGQVDAVLQEASRNNGERFTTRLTELVPDWRDVMNDPAFSDYLDQDDPMSGFSLRDLANEANKRLDANRLALFYNRYKESVGPAPAPKSEVPSKESLIAPGTARSKTSLPQRDKAEYMAANDVQQFYDDVGRGKYKDRPKAYAEMTARINRAMENRWVTA